MSMQTIIEQKLTSAFSPEFVEVLNESHAHNVPAGSESHFKVTLVSGEFTGKALLARHRAVNQVLAQELAGQVHALALHTLTPDEWFARAGRTQDSPECLGGDGTLEKGSG